MNLWIGTSGFQYKEWKGNFYPEDLAAAKMWYERAAEKNDPVALVNLGFMYQTGRGVERDAALL